MKSRNYEFDVITWVKKHDLKVAYYKLWLQDPVMQSAEARKSRVWFVVHFTSRISIDNIRLDLPLSPPEIPKTERYPFPNM